MGAGVSLWLGAFGWALALLAIGNIIARWRLDDAELDRFLRSGPWLSRQVAFYEGVTAGIRSGELERAFRENPVEGLRRLALLRRALNEGPEPLAGHAGGWRERAG